MLASMVTGGLFARVREPHRDVLRPHVRPVGTKVGAIYQTCFGCVTQQRAQHNNLPNKHPQQRAHNDIHNTTTFITQQHS